MDQHDLKITRSHFIELASKLEQNDISFPSDDLSGTMKSAAIALRLAAAYTAHDECRQSAPYAALYRIRDSSGDFWWTCDHPTPHKTRASA